MHGSSGSVASDAQIPHGLIPSISCRSAVSDTEYENVSAMQLKSQRERLRTGVILVSDY